MDVRVPTATLAYYCPICESEVQGFLPHGDPPRDNARCPGCGSLERHRLDWILFRDHTDLFDGSPKTMLHVAPEKCLVPRLRSIPNLAYVTADLNPSKGMLCMDLTHIKLPDDVFSIIYCSHVLEHIPDDRKAIAELYRVLKPGGWAVLQVPLSAAKTNENPAIVDPEERKEHFGQHDHVRRCGPDYIERMRAAGFSARPIGATEIVKASDCDRMGIQTGRVIFFCTKPSTSA
jgi:SAM-dependent methyltransferase